MRRLKAVSSKSLLASAAVLIAGGCVYSFSGGGLPGHIESIAIVPFENQTAQVTLTQELTQALSDAVPGRLGLNAADEISADAVLRGTIRGYDNSATNYQEQPGGPIIFQRRVTITVSAEIFDVTQERPIWEARSLSAVGEYQPDSETEEQARQLAIEDLTRKIIDGAQSQW